MRLCGLNIPFEYQYAEPIAANRIHDTATEVITPRNLLAYDNSDIAGMLAGRAQDAQGIWDAVQQGDCVDVEKQPIAPLIVKQELETLSADLQRIARTVLQIFATEAGKARWPHPTPLVSLDKSISITSEIASLIRMSVQFRNFATTLPEGV